MIRKTTIGLALVAALLSGNVLADVGHGEKMHGKPMNTETVGSPGNAADVTKTIKVSMNDTMTFTPSQFSADVGETVRIFVKNEGKIPHELVIGSLDNMKNHAEMMRQMPNMQHQESNMITLQPGQMSALIWKFEEQGDVDFACLIPGHMEAGMVGKVSVN
ncbi:cupredoxin domain-containing protein [Enterovibrio paralichthyis]|uniref:cupredoxin domain-containing protein n=1 Tax=Enterovibrio paralichthyis TaxID=2853805 RepID=UPI002105DD60|nr:cupredoxin family protein [Enterovibrio paralichthyis]